MVFGAKPKVGLHHIIYVLSLFEINNQSEHFSNNIFSNDSLHEITEQIMIDYWPWLLDKQNTGYNF